MQSRFGYLVEHLQPKDRKIGAVDMRFVFGLISFLRNARQFFSILANFKRGEVSGHSLTLLAEPGQGFYTGFTFTQLAGFVVGDDHKLWPSPFIGTQFRHWSPDSIRYLNIQTRPDSGIANSPSAGMFFTQNARINCAVQRSVTTRDGNGFGT